MSNVEGQGVRGKGQRTCLKFLLPIAHRLLPDTYHPSPIAHRGFTLIEVLVALAVVSGVFLMVLTSFSYHIDILDRKKDSLKLVLQAKENLYLYRTGKLIELAGTKEGIQYEIKTEDVEYHLKKVTSRTMSGKDEASLLEYMRR